MRKRQYKEYLEDGYLTLEANDGVVCLREAPLGPYKDAIALRPHRNSDASFYERLLERSIVVSEVTEFTPPNEADQIRDFKANLRDILRERRADWRLTEVSICPRCMLLEYESSTVEGKQMLQVSYGSNLEVRFKMAPTVLGYPAIYELNAMKTTPGEDGKPRWQVSLEEDLHYVCRSIWFVDGEDEDGCVSLEVTECCGY